MPNWWSTTTTDLESEYPLQPTQLRTGEDRQRWENDLICVGKQPLHAVPLFKMHARGSESDKQEDYSMPHWMNLSFYTTDRKIGYSSFIPRIKLPPLVCPTMDEARVLTCHFPPSVQDSQLPDFQFAYDEYDTNILVIPAAKNRNNSTMSKKSITGSSSNVSSPNKTVGKNGWRSESMNSSEPNILQSSVRAELCLDSHPVPLFIPVLPGCWHPAVSCRVPQHGAATYQIPA